MKYLIFLIGLFISCGTSQEDPIVPIIPVDPIDTVVIVDPVDTVVTIIEEPCEISSNFSGLIGTLDTSFHWAGNSFNRYAVPFDLDGYICPFKFYEDIDWDLPSQVELVKWEFQDVGAAKYIIYDKVEISEDSSMFYLEQEREWWNGKYNNNGYCSGGDLAVRFPHCTDFTEIDEIFGLKKVE